MRILFTGVGRRIELIQAFRSAALSLDKDLKIYGADMAGTAPALAYCDYVRRVVSMKDPSYIDELAKICCDDKIDLLIPTIDTDLQVLSEHRAKIEAGGTKVMISDADKIAVCRDKNRTAHFFTECGLRTPLPVNDWKLYKAGYPAFIKPKDGSSSINAFKVKDTEELKIYSSHIKDYIIQPFVEGREYTIDIFCDWEGNPISIVPRERIQVRAGEVLKTRIVMDQVMVSEARALCERFKPCGPITVQLIRDTKSGIDYYIEINPRFGGGAPLSMKAGARSAEFILNLVDGESVSYDGQVNDGEVYSRFDQSVCIQESAQMNIIRGIIFDLDDTLYLEKEYVKSGFKAVAAYLHDKDAENGLWRAFEQGKPAIDTYLTETGNKTKIKECVSVYRKHMPNIKLDENIKKTLQRFRQKGIKIGIITDGRPEGQKNKIVALGLDELVDDYIITDEIGGIQFRKPCDIAFRIMATRWHIPYEQLVYVADNINKDFQAPKQLGMKSILVKSKGLYYTDTYTNIRSIKDICELPSCLKIL